MGIVPGAPVSARSPLSSSTATAEAIAASPTLAADTVSNNARISDVVLLLRENVFDFNPPDKYCLVIGNEANGVSEAVKSLATHTVKIPMAKTSESLNAGVSLAITLYELTEGKGKSLIS